MRARLHLGDCLDLLRSLPDDSIDSVVTDPPYGLGKPPKTADVLEAWLAGEKAEVSGGGFMGKEWDAFVPGPRIWREVLRVTKPGGHAIVFAGTRTLDWMTMACRLAGWEVRDSGVWCYWSGFPKSLDVSKAIDRRRDDRDQVLEVTKWIAEARDAAGLTNRDIDEALGFHGMAGHWTSQKSQPSVPTLDQIPKLLEVLGNPEVPEDMQTLIIELNGLKGQPGEAWFDRGQVGEKYTVPNAKTVRPGFARIGGTPAEGEKTIEYQPTTGATEDAKRWEGWGTALKPAWEPWVVLRKPLEGTVAANVLKWGTGAVNVDGCRFKPGDPMWPGPQEAGSEDGRWPANLVHIAKPSRSERERGLDRIPGELKNDHPTVKPVRLMRWLVRLTTPPGGTVLDPFMGSGTTGAAACGQGFDFIGADLSARFVAIAHERIRHSAPGVEIEAPQEAVEILGETDAPTLWDTLGATRGLEGVEAS